MDIINEVETAAGEVGGDRRLGWLPGLSPDPQGERSTIQTWIMADVVTLDRFGMFLGNLPGNRFDGFRLNLSQNSELFADVIPADPEIVACMTMQGEPARRRGIEQNAEGAVLAAVERTGADDAPANHFATERTRCGAKIHYAAPPFWGAGRRLCAVVAAVASALAAQLSE
ncbi:hypothetical protein [Methylobacterium sp. GC_Met_2]|uniref:hypothetical protein n=1 Tax=Methylobacterium sp. GC_Met_2 TaxID=2937376 RepID=UPI00226B6DE9|nr:hypothetical protein [Methylobacterium sp. GC_Met_2]